MRAIHILCAPDIGDDDVIFSKYRTDITQDFLWLYGKRHIIAVFVELVEYDLPQGV